MEEVKKFLQSQQVSFYNYHGIVTVTLRKESSFQLVTLLLIHILTKQTCLFLSGGRTPRDLYGMLARSGLTVGAVAMVDERYGEKMHEESNERMLEESGFLSYCRYTGIPVYLQLQEGISSKETAERYDQIVRTLLAQYKKHLAVLGIGVDGHTAGIPAKDSLGLQGEALRAWLDVLDKKSRDRMVIEYDDTAGFYKKRLTMTFLGLSMLDLLVVLVFGDEKKKALQLMFADGSEEDVPARFFKRPDTAQKTFLLTDQTLE